MHLFPNDTSVPSKLFCFLPPYSEQKTSPTKLSLYDIGLRACGKLLWVVRKAHKRPNNKHQREDTQNRRTLALVEDTHSHYPLHLSLLDLIGRHPYKTLNHTHMVLNGHTI